MKDISEIIQIATPIEGWLSSEVMQLLIQCARRTPDLPIVEIGSWKGKSTVVLSLACDKKIYAIDPFTGSQEHEHLYGENVSTYEEFKKNIKQFGNETNIETMAMTSFQASQSIDEKISMLWIDGSHDYQDVYQDFSLWFDLLVSGGVILFHDSKWPGVKKVLWEEVYPHKNLGIIQRIEDTTFAFKKDYEQDNIYDLNLLKLDLEKKKQKIKNLKRKLNKWKKKQF